MSLPLSCSPYDDLLDACAPVLRPTLMVIDGGSRARVGVHGPAPLLDGSRQTGKAAVLTVRSVGGPAADCPLAGFLNR